jgi:signal peptide peptidase SppA
MKTQTKQHPHVLAAIYDQPWAITESWLETICGIVEERSKASVEEFRAAMAKQDDAEESRLQMVGAAAVIPVMGPIFPKANLMTALSGATSSQEVSDMLDEAAANVATRCIVMHIDSPGGAVVGGVEVADKIWQMQQNGIPIVAMIEGVGASLAYLWASQCSEVRVTQASIVGSVSIVSRVSSNERSMRNAGIDSITINSGALKNAGDPSTLAFAAQYQSLLSRVNTYHDMIVGSVQRARGGKMDMAKVATGDIWIGQKAVGAGLADSVSTMDALLNDINS